MSEQTSQGLNPKFLIITALITAVTTIVVAFVGIVPHLRGGDRDEIQTLKENVDKLQQKLTIVNPREDPAAATKKMSVSGTVFTSRDKAARLGGIDVYLLPEDYQLIGQTDDAGRFNIPDVPQGQYSIILRDPARGSSGKVLLDDPPAEFSVMGKWVTYQIQK